MKNKNLPAVVAEAEAGGTTKQQQHTNFILLLFLKERKQTTSERKKIMTITSALKFVSMKNKFVAVTTFSEEIVIYKNSIRNKFNNC